MQKSIQAIQVQDNLRLQFLPKYFGKHFFRSEQSIYNTLGKIAHQYTGGYWQFYELTNGGFYMAPDEDIKFKIYIEGNGYDGIVSADAAGIIVSMMVINQLCWHDPSNETMIEKYYLLREYALEHKEAQRILNALD